LRTIKSPSPPSVPPANAGLTHPSRCDRAHEWLKTAEGCGWRGPIKAGKVGVRKHCLGHNRRRK
jgi:hypothetical protein